MVPARDRNGASVVGTGTAVPRVLRGKVESSADDVEGSPLTAKQEKGPAELDSSTHGN